MAYKITFVGQGESGRSYMAKAIMDDRIRRAGMEGIEVKARGLVVLFPEPVNPKVQIVIENNQLNLEYDSMFQLEQADVDESDLLIVMTQEQKQIVLDSFENVSNIVTMKEVAKEEGELLDPYGKEVMDYEYCFRELERIIDKMMESMQVNVEQEEGEEE